MDKPNLTKWQLEEGELIRRRMSKTNEELAELMKVTSRILLQGIDGCDPETGEPNIAAFHKETADVLAQCETNIKALGMNRQAIEDRQSHKEWLMHQWESMYSETTPPPEA